ncbi:auxin efflux carrier component 5-like [Rhodamnia argentea]|uniref:Auxin efflux carrier component 5-like n=1 Tax=Rhodamnia argentea TaxID=178133 RepID=A0A8B8QG09_9MYRT|nr:auxin efflux carrier component 5-like [Rhodamnia argentea]
MLGYRSVKWWNIFTPDQCDAMNRLVCYFALPLSSPTSSRSMSIPGITCSLLPTLVSKVIIVVVVLAFWGQVQHQGELWLVHHQLLAAVHADQLTRRRRPPVKAMYGSLGVDLVIQAIVWLAIILVAHSVSFFM